MRVTARLIVGFALLSMATSASAQTLAHASVGDTAAVRTLVARLVLERF